MHSLTARQVEPLRPVTEHTIMDVDDAAYDSGADFEGLLPLGESAHPVRPRRTHRSSNLLPRNLEWLAGPTEPRKFTLRPLFGKAEANLSNCRARFASTSLKTYMILIIASLVWIVVFSSLATYQNSGPDLPDYGPVRRLTCSSSPWLNKRQNCGLNGTDCLPFDGASYPFRCPSGCVGAQVWDPYVVGDQVIQYSPLVIGGSDLNDQKYRGDSFICSAAIHAGIISNSKGGCGILQLLGEKDRYPSTVSNGIESISFDYSFPMSFSISLAPGVTCSDVRWSTLMVSVLFTAFISLFGIHPAFVYFSTLFVTFFHVAIISDTPEVEHAVTLVQYAVSRFLPTAFIALTIYTNYAKITLGASGARIDRTLLWLGGYWIGALENYTIDKLPIRRLTPRDISTQPGAAVILLGIIALIVVIAIVQARCFWIEGRLPQYLALYLGMIAVLLSLAFLPGLNLRIHHYVLALLLLPGTALQTRPSLFFQGLLLGLFVNGVARWGFASLLETDLWLADKGPIGSPLPDITKPVIKGGQITFSWASQLAKNWDGISVRVNDVDRFRWFKGQSPSSFSWTRGKDEDLFFRFGLIRAGFVDGFLQGDYTLPGTWFKNDTWIDH